jgi:hypothetical protein
MAITINDREKKMRAKNVSCFGWRASPHFLAWTALYSQALK